MKIRRRFEGEDRKLNRRRKIGWKTGEKIDEKTDKIRKA